MSLALYAAFVKHIADAAQILDQHGPELGRETLRIMLTSSQKLSHLISERIAKIDDIKLDR